jgi:hypothetical protein
LGKITIKRGPAKRLGMESGMTMVYKAQDPASRATRRRVRGTLEQQPDMRGLIALLA